MKVSNIDEVIEAMRYECFKARGQKHYAELKGLSQSTLSAVLNGKRTPTDKMIKEAGYELRYVKANQSKD